MHQTTTKVMARNPVMNEKEIQEWRQHGAREKKLLLVTLSVFTAGILALVLLSTTAAFPAQTAQAPEHGGWHQRGMRRGPDQELARLGKMLSLTDAQKAKIKPILDNEHQQLTSLRADTSLSREDRRAKFMSIHSKTFDQIQPILTTAQQAKLHHMQQEREQRMKAWREKHGGTPGSGSQSQ